jgi:hypothetical protein
MNRIKHRMGRGTPEPWNKGHGIYFRSSIRFLYQFPTGILIQDKICTFRFYYLLKYLQHKFSNLANMNNLNTCNRRLSCSMVALLLDAGKHKLRYLHNHIMVQCDITATMQQVVFIIDYFSIKKR